jgi:UDP-glucose 4,6-dehydratase
MNFILEEERIEVVMHFAAQTHVDNSFGNSIEFTKNNILGTHVLLECVKSYGKITKFIHVSTDEVYGEQTIDETPRIEKSILEPTNPYAATKASAEFLVKSYAKSFGIPVIITRGNNVYGPHQFPEKMIPRFICQLFQNKPITIHGRGESRRNFLYVEDVARAFETILFHGQIGECYNIGGTNEFSVYNVAQMLIAKINDEIPECGVNFTFVEDRPFNDFRYSIDSTKLHELGWVEQKSWDDGLQETIQWYFKHRNRYNNY